VGILLAEQNTNVALKDEDYGYILESGRIMMDGLAKWLAENTDVKEFYLGLSTEGRQSFRDRKSYRRPQALAVRLPNSGVPGTKPDHTFRLSTS
jgi:branched-chain amino acid transport system ATP-binding protein